MATWELLLSLDESARTQLQDIYLQRKFPFDVRGYLASWIEDQPWSELDQNKVEHGAKVQELYNELIGLVEDKGSQQGGTDLMTQMRYVMHLKSLKQMYDSNPWLLVATIADILKEERSLIDQLTQKMCDVGMTKSPEMLDVAMFMQQLKETSKGIEAETRCYKQQQEEFVFNYQEVGKLEGEKQRIQMDPNIVEHEKRIAEQELTLRHKTVLEQLKLHAVRMLDEREKLLLKMQQYYAEVENSSCQVFEDLFRWKLTQQKSMSGGPEPTSLDGLQSMFEDLADLLWKLCGFTNQMKHLYDALPVTRSEGNEKMRIEELVEKSQICLTQIILKSFIVDKQPPQVLKTQTRFQASVRLLVGRQLNVHANCPEVVTTILSEKQAKDVVHGKDPAEAGNCGDLLNFKSVMEFEQAAAMLHADFKNLSLKRIRRQDRRNQESVLEAKSALVFSTAVAIGGRNLPVRCMSLPVVVVVHGNQGPNSEATIVWDNMFSQPDREPFEVPDEVPWGDMKDALNARWCMTTGKELTEVHLIYLGNKLFPDCPYGDYDDKKVSWTAFNKEPLPGRNFTFWEWFHGAMEVVKKHLKEHWLSGHVEFITRLHCQELMRQSPPGTFLIRFSDGEIGGVTIAWVQPYNAGDQREILNLQPWTSKDFVIISLADRIFDLPELLYLYPKIDKQEAFARFRSREPVNELSQDYVTARIMATINLSGSSAPASPFAAHSAVLPSVPVEQSYSYTHPDTYTAHTSMPPVGSWSEHDVTFDSLTRYLGSE